jgi:hypothetical protein
VSPRAVCLFVGEVNKKTRITAGLSDHGRGYSLHVYYRDFYESLSSKEVRAIFRKATEMLEAHASPTRAVPPPPAKLLEVVSRSPPLPTASSPPLPVYDITTEYNFDGTSYGKDYLSLQCGQKLKLLPFPEDGEGWWFGEVAITGHRGWFPPSFVSEWF